MLKRYRFIPVLLCLAGLVTTPAAAQEEEKPRTVEQRLDRIERLISSQGLLNMLDQIKQLQQEVSQLRGEIESQNHKIDQLQQRQRNLYADIDQRMQRLESGNVSGTTRPEYGDDGPPLTALSPVPDSDTSADGSSGNALTLEVTDGEDQTDTQTATGTAGTATGTEEGSDIQPAAVEQAANISPVQIQAQYQDAFGLLKQSRYDQAIRSFNEFLSAYPDTEFSDNAQYWLAEAHYVTRNFEPALEEYQKLVDQYPDSQKLTHALLKIGYTLQALDRMDEAKQQLQDLIQKYPGTTAARLADERLSDIKSGAQPEADTDTTSTPGQG